MNASILSVGTELLFGQIINTNAAWLSERLQDLGVNVLYHFTVGDNQNRLRKSIEHAFEESDLVISTGGLGPTQDDMTKEIIAEYFGDELVEDAEALRKLEKIFSSAHREMTENNRKQAKLPSRAKVLYNSFGTAPGFILEGDGRMIIALPGPPREMKGLFEEHVEPFLAQKSGAVISYKMLRFYGIGESSLETTLLPLIDGQKDPTLATYAKEGECSLRIASRRSTKEEAEQAVDKMIEKVREIVGGYLYSEDDEDMPALVARLLIEKKITLASAESCTGGLFAATLLDMPGISAVYDRGFITYSNKAKTEELGIPESLIEEHGAVSREVAIAMATGARAQAKTDMGISVTGVAGPDGGTEEKPVGLAWIACDFGGKITTKKYYFNDRGRRWNRWVFCLEMFDLIRQQII